MALAPHDLKTEQSHVREKLSRTLFFLYVIFMLAGPAPLQDKQNKEVPEVSTSSSVNQIVDSVIPFLSLLCLLPKRRALVELLKKEKYLTLFLIWCLVSVSWSHFPLNSLKAWVRSLGSTIVVLAFFLNLNSLDEALKFLKSAFALYVPLSFLAIAYLPWGIQWEFPAWRGLADHKNTLGQISFISTLVWASALREPSARKRMVSVLFLVASLILLLGSKSTTSLMALLSVPLMAVYVFVERQLKTARVVSLGCLSMLFLLIQVVGLDTITAVFGKDTTFTGRDDLWATMLAEIKTHPLIGCGFSGFWVTENPSVVMRIYDYEEDSWHPTGGHEGYLDILNETGIVGLFLLILMVTSYFGNLLKLRKPHFWKWFFIGILLINLSESTLFRSGSFSGWFFVCIYLALHVQLLHSHTRLSARLEAA